MEHPFGLPYKGSKSTIAQWVVQQMPSATHFYDLFAGGGAVTHAAILSGKYKVFHMNDLDGQMPQFFVNALNGAYKDCNTWVSREDFFRLKDSDPFVRYIWSFGNKGKTYIYGAYIYGADIEEQKHAIHEAVVNKDFSLLAAELPQICEKAQAALRNVEGVYNRRLAMKRVVEGCSLDPRLLNAQHLQAIQRCQHLERAERVAKLDSRLLQSEALSRMERVGSLGFIKGKPEIVTTARSYADMEILPDSVVYCDPPYIGTDDYNVGGFDHEAFYAWLLSQPFPVYVSEYYMPADFACVAAKTKTETFSQTKVNKKVERIFVQRKFADRVRRTTLFDEEVFFCR